ncbi:DUF6653 family protein [uncultured Jannaschia sp.]|uniref:DUF6653 family protein n=1 Tax=uncultured Jannaschia sp. TaxID=293347 RepID=UPI0026229A8D|nr:DUF6653 family protein [uncultured Jannaschia sp.]
MDVFRGAERMMAMDDATWRRHANPWSVWSRFTVLPLLVLAIWSRVWLGWWALLPIALALGWNWLNPRVFPPVDRLGGWAGRAVMGERIFLEHRSEIAPHHRRAATVLTWASAAGAVPLVVGLWALWWEGAVFGTLLAALPKVWFCDRMVWIYEDWVGAGRALPGEDMT